VTVDSVKLHTTFIKGNSKSAMVSTKHDKINNDALGTGRRKSSIARVRVRAGSGNVTINRKPLDEYFPVAQDQRAVVDVLEHVGRRSDVDVQIRVKGGGTTGQAGACRMGIARALVSYNEEHFQPLRDGGFLTRDSRMKERKKYGLHGARKGTQFSKR
jgi:small subunit ribosomal protein S9